MDITMITGAYSAIKAIKEMGSALLNAKIDSEAKQRATEILDKLGTVQDSLFFIREELIRVQDENQSLKVTIKELEQQIDLRGKVVYEKPSYWIYDGEKKDGPFCQRCFDVTMKLVRLQGGNNDVWVCHECKTVFYGPNYQPRPTRAVVSKGYKSWLDR